MMASSIVGIVGSLLTILAIWVGVVRIDLKRPWRFILAFLEFAVLGASLYFLGPIVGPVLALTGVVVWFLIVSVRMAIQYDELATDAAIHWSTERAEAKAFIRQLVKEQGRPLQFIGLLGTARLAAALAKRARSRDEVALMVGPVAMLCAIFHEKPEDLAPRFDELMRRFGEPAERSTHVADILTAASRMTPGSFQNVLLAVEAFMAGGPAR